MLATMANQSGLSATMGYLWDAASKTSPRSRRVTLDLTSAVFATFGCLPCSQQPCCGELLESSNAITVNKQLCAA